VLAGSGVNAADAEGAGIYIPESNDPHETPFYHRPDVMVRDIIPIEDAAY
jgi:hypothetical protein